MKRIIIFLLLCVPVHVYASMGSDEGFARIAKIQEELEFWQGEFKRLEKQKEKGNVSQAYLMMLNAVLSQMQTLRKEANALIEQTRQEEEKIKKEQEAPC